MVEVANYALASRHLCQKLAFLNLQVAEWKGVRCAMMHTEVFHARPMSSCPNPLVSNLLESFVELRLGIQRDWLLISHLYRRSE